MAYDKNRLVRNCPMGQMLAEKIDDIATLKTQMAALQTKLATVLAATAADSTKTLKIDTSGNVELTA